MSNSVNGKGIIHTYTTINNNGSDNKLSRSLYKSSSWFQQHLFEINTGIHYIDIHTLTQDIYRI